MSADDIHFFLHLREQIKVYHWQTRVYARHIATDKVLIALDELIDKYVEIYIGKYGRPKLSQTSGTIRIQNMTEAGATKLIQSSIKHLQTKFVRKLSRDRDTDLINLRDEIVGELNKLLYLFTLK
jgi:hypothetical protein